MDSTHHAAMSSVSARRFHSSTFPGDGASRPYHRGPGRGGEERTSKRSGTPTVIEVELPIGAEVRETFLEVRTASEGEVVTVLELLSPANKRFGTGRRMYLDKRELILSTRTSLVELDLLRAGDATPTVGPRVRSDYSLLVSRAHRREKADLVPFGVRDAIPAFLAAAAARGGRAVGGPCQGIAHSLRPPELRSPHRLRAGTGSAAHSL